VKIAFLSYSDLNGGAAIAAFRLYKSLQNRGVEVGMLVDKLVANTDGILQLPVLERLFKRLLRYGTRRILDYRYPLRSRVHFSISPTPDVLLPSPITNGANVVHAHWTGNSFLGLGALERMRLPIVWTLHDMMPFTGGCHYDSHCGRYTASCGVCPVLGSNDPHDVSWHELRSKAEIVQRLKLIVVCPSRWLAACARSSRIFRDADIRVVPYGLDLNVFKPESQAQARSRLCLPQNVPLILIGAFGGLRDPRKGYAEVCHTINRSAENWIGTRPQIVVFGHGEQPTGLLENFRCHLVGSVHDDALLASLYSAADVFLAPSRQDNLPNTIMEALACGTPVVSCHVGGIPEMVDHMQNGYLARADAPQDLEIGLHWVLAGTHRLGALRTAARDKAQREFCKDLQSTRYVELYTELLGNSH